MDKKRAKKRFAAAENLFGNADFLGALKHLDALDTAFPQQKNVLFAQARCYSALGQLDEARELCIQCVSQWDAPRAQRLLDRLDDRELSDPQFSDFDAELEFDRSDAYAVPEIRSVPPWRRVSFVVIAVLGTIGVASALGYSWQVSRPPMATAAFTPGELHRQVVSYNQERQDRIETLHSQPGQVIPERYWRLSAIGDYPDWQPGIYKSVPCAGAYYTQPSGKITLRTISVYIPMAYEERPDELFSVVAISSPGRDKGRFGNLENWAERNDVVLVFIETSSNEQYSNNWQAQDVAIAVVGATMRVDARMGIAIGMSGGAATSWEMICRYPDNFVGLVMMGFGSSHNDCWIPAHIKVGYIHGMEDFNNWNIARTIPKLRAAGNSVREKVVPGGHVTGPLAERERMLSWILEEARRELGTMNVSGAPNPSTEQNGLNATR